MQKRIVICPERQRHLERPFGWIPIWIMTEGRWGILNCEAKVLYAFLCVVSDREGMSCYGRRRISQLLRISEEGLQEATRELCQRDFICFDGRYYQVLALERHPALRTTGQAAGASSSVLIARQSPSPICDEALEIKHIRTILEKLGQGASHA